MGGWLVSCHHPSHSSLVVTLQPAFFRVYKVSRIALLILQGACEKHCYFCMTLCFHKQYEGLEVVFASCTLNHATGSVTSSLTVNIKKARGVEEESGMT